MRKTRGCADLCSLGWQSGERSERVFWCAAAVGSGLGDVVGLVDEVVEDSEGVLGSLVVGHRSAGLERLVVTVWSGAARAEAMAARRWAHSLPARYLRVRPVLAMPSKKAACSR